MLLFHHTSYLAHHTLFTSLAFILLQIPWGVLLPQSSFIVITIYIYLVASDPRDPHVRSLPFVTGFEVHYPVKCNCTLRHG